MKSILAVEDDAPVREVIRFSLERAGFAVTGVRDARAALEHIDFALPDLVILDLILPDMHGIELLRMWRADERTKLLPVVILTGRAEERDRVAGLRSGADDYVVKPFSRDELVARIENIFKRTNPVNGKEVIEIRGLKLDSRSVRVTVNEQPVALGPLEFRLLRLFMSQPHRVHTRGEIIDRVWRSKGYVEQRAVDTQIRRLRRRLEETGHAACIETVRGIGYRFSPLPPAAG